MPQMSEIEAELVKATKFKGKFADRQDYLASLLQAIDGKLSDDQYDDLSDEAVNWHHKAVAAMDKKQTIPDFQPEEEPSEDVEEADIEEETEPEEAVKAEPAMVEVESKSWDDTPRKLVPVVEKQPTPQYTRLSGEKNRYGIIKGTKTDAAIAMYEKGTTAAQLMDALQGRYYNVLQKLIKEGHRVEKREGGIFKLTHRDDLKDK